MKSLSIRLASGVVLLAAMVYSGDWGVLRYRVWRHENAFGTVTVTPVYVIHEKNGKTEYQYDPPLDQTCVHALLPHFGYSPCWYVSRHQEQHIEI
jgi:hypothetical protein